MMPYDNHNSTIRIFCFPYAGGSSAIFRGWQNYLPPGIELFPVEYPGHGSRFREKLAVSLQTLVREMADYLNGQVRGPFAFFGHSMGALVAFELSRYLRRKGMPTPDKLLVSANSAPQIYRRLPATYHLPEEEFINRLASLNGTPKEVINDRELLSLLLPILRADFRICETYHYQNEPPLDIPIVGFGGMHDSDVTATEINAWAQQTSHKFDLHLLPGDHFFIQSNRGQLLQMIAKEI